MNSLDALFAKATLLQQQNQLPEAITLYQQLITQQPTYPDAQHYLGLAYAQQERLAQAIEHLQQALMNDDSPVIHNNLANAYKKNNNPAQAIKHYQQAINLAPDYALAHNNLAGLYAQQHNYSQALHHYRLAVHAQPDFSPAHFNLGLLLLQQNHLDAATVQFNNVLALASNHLPSQFYLGVIALAGEHLDAAKQAFEAVLTQDNHHLDALTNLGVVALKQQQRQLAVDYFTKALALNNDHIEARSNLAATFMHYDRFENALMHYDVLLKHEPNNNDYLYNSGVAEMALGHLKKALAHFEQLIHLQPDHFAALNNLAAVYLRLGNRDQARVLLEQALKANPNDNSSRHMLHALTGQLNAATYPEYATNLFNNYALYYDGHMQQQLNYTLPNHIVHLLSELAITSVDHVLDLGCGTGLTGQAIRDISIKLEGVDIAAKMLDCAQEKGIYDALIHMDALTFLTKHCQAHNSPYGLIVALDVLPYFGDLTALFSVLTRCLAPAGYFIFSTEISHTKPWQLQSSARFAHHADYLQQLACDNQLTVRITKTVVARQQDGQPLSVYLMVLQKQPS